MKKKKTQDAVAWQTLQLFTVRPYSRMETYRIIVSGFNNQLQLRVFYETHKKFVILNFAIVSSTLILAYF